MLYTAPRPHTETFLIIQLPSKGAFGDILGRLDSLVQWNQTYRVHSLGDGVKSRASSRTFLGKRPPVIGAFIAAALPSRMMIAATTKLVSGNAGEQHSNTAAHQTQGRRQHAAYVTRDLPESNGVCHGVWAANGFGMKRHRLNSICDTY